MPKTISQDEKEEIHALCRASILKAFHSGIQKFKDIQTPEGCKDYHLRLSLKLLIESGEVVQEGKRRGARYFLKAACVDGAPPKAEEKRLRNGEPKEKISEFIGSMLSGEPGKAMRMTPKDTAKKFAERYGFELNESWDEVNAACRDGRLSYDFFFEDGPTAFLLENVRFVSENQKRHRVSHDGNHGNYRSHYRQPRRS